MKKLAFLGMGIALALQLHCKSFKALSRKALMKNGSMQQAHFPQPLLQPEHSLPEKLLPVQ